MTLSQHLSTTNENYTPEDIICRVTKTLGQIDLDPASCEMANRVVKARHYFTQEDDGLNKSWGGYGDTVFCNPPGGVIKVPNEKGLKSQQSIWWNKFCYEGCKSFKSGIFLSFNLELLQNIQNTKYITYPLDYSFCIPSSRISYNDKNLIKRKQPPHASFIICLSCYDELHQNFKNNFSDLGYTNII